MLRTIIRPERKNGRSGGVPQTNAVGFRMIVRSLAEFVSQLLIENCDMHDRHRAARACRPKLLTKDAVLASDYWRVIKPAGVNRDFVPMADPVRGTDPMQNRMG
jgi:hypothetical protein